MSKDVFKIKTLGELKASAYVSTSVKEELRKNLVEALKNNEPCFEGIHGYEDTVVPDMERAILSQHNVLLLGLRGQAKTRLARMLIGLLDEYIPIIRGSEINDDPLNPISKFGRDLIQEKGDDTPIDWLHRENRYVEKLATPDVNIADLIGDVDPIKAANLKLPYSDERVIHFGLVPRAHRCLFVINELPDLQARIQVSLFNILQEGDLQIRGFKFRLPLDIMFTFTANPEDYTNRGSIVTPLKDRIESQILTHYPKTLETARLITDQEVKITESQEKSVNVPEHIKDILELVSFYARESDYIDEKSGVSARLSISAYENLISAAERRMLINNEKKTTARITDLWGIIPAITGKVELVYEGEQEGPYAVALDLIHKAIKEKFLEFFPSPEYKNQDRDPYGVIKQWFGSGNTVDLLNDSSDKKFIKTIDRIVGLDRLLEAKKIDKDQIIPMKELCLHGMAECELLEKTIIDTVFNFSDPLADMLNDFE